MNTESENIINSVMANLELGDWKEAQGIFNSVAPHITQKLINDYKLKGNKAFAKKNYNEAIDFYVGSLGGHYMGKSNKEITSSEEISILISNLSACYLAIGKIDKAKALAVDVIELQPSWYKGYYRKARALFEEKKYEEALSSLEIAKEKCGESEQSGMKLIAEWIKKAVWYNSMLNRIDNNYKRFEDIEGNGEDENTQKSQSTPLSIEYSQNLDPMQRRAIEQLLGGNTEQK